MNYQNAACCSTLVWFSVQLGKYNFNASFDFKANLMSKDVTFEDVKCYFCSFS